MSHVMSCQYEKFFIDNFPDAYCHTLMMGSTKPFPTLGISQILMSGVEIFWSSLPKMTANGNTPQISPLPPMKKVLDMPLPLLQIEILGLFDFSILPINIKYSLITYSQGLVGLTLINS